MIYRIISTFVHVIMPIDSPCCRWAFFVPKKSRLTFHKRGGITTKLLLNSYSFAKIILKIKIVKWRDYLR